MDLLLGSFADRHLPAFSPEQLDAYEAILQQTDPDLYDWITGKSALPTERDGEVMRMLVEHRYARSG